MLKRLSLLIPTLAFATWRVDNFETAGTTSPRGGPWITYHDSLSTQPTWTRAKAPGAGDSGHCGRLDVTLSGTSGYAGASGSFNATWATVDLSAYAGVRLHLRSNAGVVRIQLPITATNKTYNHYTKLLDGVDTSWQLFEIPFSRLKQEWGTSVTWSPSTILQVAVVLGNTAKAAVWAEVDNIEFYKAEEATLQLDTSTSIFVSKCPKVNQVGYDPTDPKVAIGTVPFMNTGDSLWVVDNSSHRVWGTVFGKTINDSLSSGESVVRGDFSGFTTAGTWRIESNGQFSASFRIGSAVMSDLYGNALRSFQSIRCGIAVHDERIGMDHAPCHLQDTIRSDGGLAGDFTGGWHNAGDFGKWVPEAAVSTSLFLWLSELDGARSGQFPSGREALLDEARWGLQWILKMQRLDGSMLHKVDPQPVFAWGVAPDADKLTRWASLQSKDSTQASSVDAAHAVAVFTQGARVFEKFDPEFASRLSRAADMSWAWLAGHPGIGQNDIYYTDPDSRQEEFWAQAERVRKTKSDSLQKVAKTTLSTLWFSETSFLAPQLLGALTIQSDSSCPKDLRDAATNALRNVAKNLLAKSRATGYRVAMNSDDYIWESNEIVLHRGEALLYGYLATGDTALRTASRAQLDYVLGQNPLDTSYVAGFGQKAIHRPYHWSTMVYGKPLPGWVTGGPNNHAATMESVSYDAALFDLVNSRHAPPAKSYLDLCSTSGSYASNEGETSEQAALVFLSGWFSGPGAWAAPTVSVSEKRPKQKLSAPSIRRQGENWQVSWPGHAKARLEIRDIQGRSEATLTLDDQGNRNWLPTRKGLAIIVSQDDPSSAVRLWIP